tara:strand:+ start:208 stop:618 length:411 start_codon:yes stop_codon:yes gene_type:complete
LNINKGKVMSSLECKKCGRLVENVGDNAKSVTCSVCVLLAVGLPEEKKSYQPTGRPPGWHFMSEFVDKDGNVFHKGKEMKKLKGTLKPTKVKSPKKRIKRRTKDAILVEKYNEKKKALKKAVKKQQDFINHNISKG